MGLWESLWESAENRPLLADYGGVRLSDACDDSGERWLVHHDDLLEAVVLLG